MSELGIKKLDEINNLTLTEFYYRLHALDVINLKEEFNMLKLAFFIRDVATTKNVGTDKSPKEVYVFDSINDILDYEENYYRLFEGKERIYKNQTKEVSNDDHKLAALFAEFNNKQ